MNRRDTQLILCCLALLGLACTDDSLPITPGKSQIEDNLSIAVTPFVIEQAYDFRHSYTLDDTVSWMLSLTNYSRLSPFHVRTHHDPPWTWSASFPNSDSILADGPFWADYSCWSGDLQPRDSLHYSLSWDLFTYFYNPVGFQWLGLKAFSGVYLIKMTIGTNLPTLTKLVTITEDGDPLSAATLSRSTRDSIIIDLIARNRVTTQQIHQVDGPCPVTVIYTTALGPYDTLLVDSLAFPRNSIELSPHSDSKIFSFSRSRSDSVFHQLRNVFVITVALRLEDRQLISFSAFVDPWMQDNPLVHLRPNQRLNLTE